MSKNKIVALHGFLGEGSDFDLLSSAFKSRGVDVDLICPSYFSPAKKEEKSFDLAGVKSLEEAGDKLNLWAEKNLNSADENYLMGYSLGGRIALHAATRNPNFWRHTFLLSTHPGFLTQDDRALRKEQDHSWSKAFECEPWDEVVKKWMSQPVFGETQSPQRLEEHFDRKILAQVLRALSVAEQELSFSDFMRAREKITWFVGQTDLKYLSLIKELQIKQLAPLSEIVGEAGHRIHLDNPEELVERIESWF